VIRSTGLLLCLIACGGEVSRGGGGERDGGEEVAGDGGVGAPDGGPVSTPVMPILEGDGFYPRAIALDDGVILASIVSPQASGKLGGTILESRDGGVSFAIVGNVDGDHAAGGLCCATLYQLPAALGGLPAGALLWSASVGGDAPGAPMAVPVFASTDRGRTWSFLSNVTVAGVPRSQGGLWEPEFSQLDDGSLVCHYSDETDPGHSQKLVARRSTDGVGWPELRETVAMPAFAARPGMPVVRRAPDGRFAMSFEICGVDGCATHLRFSDDGWSWGDPAATGLRPATLEGLHFRHAPTLAITGSPGNGRFYLIGQMLTDGAGAPSAGNGVVILGNTEGGGGAWFEIEAPVPVPDAYDNFCPNYSSTILPVDGGRVALEIASRWQDGRCRSFFARGPLVGTGDASTVEDGASYRLTSLQSGFCLDVVDGSPDPGADIRQWDCNGSGAQRFAIDRQPDGSVRLVVEASGLCVGALGDAAGADVVQVPCAEATRWRIENVGTRYHRLVHAGQGACPRRRRRLDRDGGQRPAVDVQ
jgi:hypothetical protein